MAGPATWDETANVEEGVDTDFGAVSPDWDDEATEATTDFDSTTTSGTGAFSAHASAVKLGTNGFLIDPGSEDTAYGTFSTGVTAETHVTIEFWFDPNSLTMTDGDTFQIMSTNGQLRIDFRLSGATLQCRALTFTDTGTKATGWHTISDDYTNHIRVIWNASTSAGADNGSTYLYLDGQLVEIESGLDNDTLTVGEIRYGAAAALDAGTSGTFFMDNCNWSDGAGSPPWITENAQMGGTYGMAISLFGDTTGSYGQLSGPSADTVMTVQFDFDINSLTMGTDEIFTIMNSAGEFQVRVQWTGSVYQIFSVINTDTGTTTGSKTTLSDAPVTVTVAWAAATSAGANNGYMNTYVDDALISSIIGVNNDTLSSDLIRFGAAAGTDSGTTGTIFFDDMVWSDNGDFYPVLLGVLTNTGVPNKLINKIPFAGSITNTGSMAQRANKIMAGVLAMSGTMAQLAQKVVGGVLTPAGALKSLRRKVINFIIDVIIESGMRLDAELVNEDDPEGRV